jgi:cobalt-zinc-cadmium efflux system protein
VAAILAGLAVRYKGWIIADPIASIVMTLLIVRGAWSLVRESVDVLLESVPPHISLEAVRTAIAAVPGVCSVHDLHVWTVTSGMVAMSAHVVAPDAARHQEALEQVHAAMARFGISHVTVQIEGQELADCVPHR